MFSIITATLLVILGTLVAGFVLPVVIALMRPSEKPKTLIKRPGGFYKYTGKNYRA